LSNGYQELENARARNIVMSAMMDVTIGSTGVILDSLPVKPFDLQKRLDTVQELLDLPPKS